MRLGVRTSDIFRSNLKPAEKRGGLLNNGVSTHIPGPLMDEVKLEKIRERYKNSISSSGLEEMIQRLRRMRNFIRAGSRISFLNERDVSCLKQSSRTLLGFLCRCPIHEQTALAAKGISLHF